MITHTALPENGEGDPGEAPILRAIGAEEIYRR
jgi:hypothetical protein